MEGGLEETVPFFEEIVGEELPVLGKEVSSLGEVEVGVAEGVGDCEGGSDTPLGKEVIMLASSSFLCHSSIHSETLYMGSTCSSLFSSSPFSLATLTCSLCRSSWFRLHRHKGEMQLYMAMIRWAGCRIIPVMDIAIDVVNTAFGVHYFLHFPQQIHVVSVNHLSALLQCLYRAR